MNAQRGRRKIACGLVVSVGLAACGPSAVPSPVVVTHREHVNLPATIAGASSTSEEVPTKSPEPGATIPVMTTDPSWGNPLAPVTMVIWGDYECPYTAKLVNYTLPQLQEQYGPNRLRVIWKHFPLPFHKNAHPAHVAAETVFQLGGSVAFWKFHDLAFGNQKLLELASFVIWAKESGVDATTFKEEFFEERYASRVEADIAVGKNVGVSGTPASFINGVYVSGARSIDDFRHVIDGQLEEAAALHREGVPAEHVYAQLSEKNYMKPAPPAPSTPPPDTTTVWNVPIDGSPVRGPKTAPVTMIMFGDFQCPFCKRVAPTIADLERKYGNNLRFVFKHNPLPMHPRAEPVAEFVIEAGAQKGEAVFWKAFQAIYDDPTKLEDSDLEDLAKTLGLDPRRVKKALDGHVHAARIDRDQILADDVQASGTPHFFINGRRLLGAQPMEKFEAMIDEEIVKAGQLVAAGTAPDKLYEVLMKDGKTATIQRILAPAPTRDNPAKGAQLGAPITIQMFADFQCPYCKRSQAVIDQIVAHYPGKVRVVWRHLPLSTHGFAQMAAEASVEAFRQKGDAGFWAFAARLWELQSNLQAFDRAGIERAAAEAGLDVAKLSAALDARTHWKTVAADSELAARLKISGTPGFVINDYFVSGAQPFQAFKRRIDEALGAHKPIDKQLLIADARTPAPLDATSPPPLFTPPPSAPPVAPSPAKLGAKHIIVMYAGSMRAPANIARTRAEALARASEARKKLAGGALFEDIVTIYSDEPGAAQRGGDLGVFPRGAMVPEFQTALENIAVGDMSGVVETRFGFHIILRTK